MFGRATFVLFAALASGLGSASPALHGQEPDTLGALPRAGVAAADSFDLSELAILTGVVTGSSLDDRLGGAYVYVRDQPFSAVTDSLGRYALPVPEGLWMVSVFHERAGEIGLPQPPTSLVTVQRGSTVRVDFTLDPSIVGSQLRPYALDAMEVVVRGTRSERRMRRGARYDVLADRVLEQRLPSARHVGDLIQGQFLGVRVRQYDPGDLCIQAPRAAMARSLRLSPTACTGRVAVVLDGLLLDEPGSWLVGFPPQNIERVEFLSALDASTRYGKYAANGVLFIYTR